MPLNATGEASSAIDVGARTPYIDAIHAQLGTGRVPDGMTPGETIEEAKQGLIDDFAFLGDWVQRYEYIVDLGRALEGLHEAEMIDSHLVPGCQSRVWFHAEETDGRLHFRADSDAIIVRGLIALLLRVYSGRHPAEILAMPPSFFEVLELGSHLSGSRANGLHAMVQRIQAYAGREPVTSADMDPPA